MSPRSPDVIVIGAGPYGLAAAAELRGAGAGVHVLGAPMSFWKQHMPRGMRLRSPWGASHIGAPRSAHTLDAFEAARGTPISRPVPLADFVAYGHWFQERNVPEVDSRRVERVEAEGPGFRILLDDGEQITTARVVVAAGIADFAWRPPEFDGLPQDLVSHSSEHADLGRFAGRRVVVVGGGQSAFESAVLLKENGADVELLMRAVRTRWVGRATRKGLLGRLLFDRTDVGPVFLSHLIARPRLLRRLPRRVHRDVMRRALAPGASLWLRPRSEGMAITAGRHVTDLTRSNGHLQLRLDDGTSREVDHVLLATGYRVDVHRYRFLAPELLSGLDCVDGYPVLGEGLASSVPGLHFLGAPAAHSFGPLVRFVSGTEFSARALARYVTKGQARVTDRGRTDRAFDLVAPDQRSP
ncbi:MAG: NAD(P)/FAD-dependent oxidoreductase [Chloroflexi bacterium]|nr:MAG: NAD(P)/FAD-dependent oxidoreductase [Chloroflexota bacterium]